MFWAWLTAVVLVVLFSFVLLRGAPYVPTMKKQVRIGLDLLDLKPGQTLLEPGCGDGKVLVAAAERGIRAIGYELNPLLALIAWLRTRRFGDMVEVHLGDFWLADWPHTDGIYVFLLDPFMQKLDTKIVQSYRHKRVRLVSNAFKVPGKAPKAEQYGLFLYEYK